MKGYMESVTDLEKFIKKSPSIINKNINELFNLFTDFPKEITEE